MSDRQKSVALTITHCYERPSVYTSYGTAVLQCTLGRSVAMEMLHMHAHTHTHTHTC